jgi:Translationally controlled tumour protein
MNMIKTYLKRVVAFLKEKGKEDRVKGFQAGATELIKFIMAKYDEF